MPLKASTDSTGYVKASPPPVQVCPLPTEGATQYHNCVVFGSEDDRAVSGVHELLLESVKVVVASFPAYQLIDTTISVAPVVSIADVV